MILYEIKGNELKTIQPDNLVCPHCGNSGTLELICYVRHVRFLGLPMFPLRKEVLNHCKSCGKRAATRHQVPGLQRQEEILKYQSKVPVSTLSGSLLLLSILVFAGYLLFGNGLKSHSFLLEPQAGDVYQIKNEDNMYTLWMLDSLYGDSFSIQRNLYTVNSPSYYDQIRADSNFNSIHFITHRDTLIKWKQKGKLLKVERLKTE